MKRRFSKMHHLEREGVFCPGSLNAVLCFLGITNHQALQALHQVTYPKSCSSWVARGFLTPERGVTLWLPGKGSICHRLSWGAGGRSGDTSGRLQGWLTVRPRLLFSEGNGSPQLCSWASGTRPAGLLGEKFCDVAVLFSRVKEVASLVYPASLTRCLCTGLAKFSKLLCWLTYHISQCKTMIT